MMKPSTARNPASGAGTVAGGNCPISRDKLPDAQTQRAVDHPGVTAFTASVHPDDIGDTAGEHNACRGASSQSLETTMTMFRNAFISGAMAISTLAVLGAGPVLARTPAPKDAEVYIISPADGDTVSSPVTIQFGLKGMGVAPAGVDKPNTGHHHLIIDAALPPLDAPVPADANHKHFGGGQTETSIELAPGKHTLQLIMGDLMHVPHEPPVMSRKITITVK